jgi:hypothetical protein
VCVCICIYERGETVLHRRRRKKKKKKKRRRKRSAKRRQRRRRRMMRRCMHTPSRRCSQSKPHALVA